ncbi:MAG: rnz, partial [Thermoleophilia bacterium]|nr:rnz [Thermoleophilia bacterium]
MDLDVVFLGTAASVPSASRGLSSVLVRRGGDRILIDCGEGTQRQLMRSTGLVELDAILITHLHADHVLGLPGMLKSFGLRDRTAPLVLAGPAGLHRFWTDMRRAVIGTLPFDVELVTVHHEVAWYGEGYEIAAVPTEHGVPSVGWRLVEEDRPGRFDVDRARELGVREGADFGVLQRGGEVTTADGAVVTAEQVVGGARSGRCIVYSGDTSACSAIRDASRDATLLVHEATFLQEDVDRAADTHHSTARDAALVAAAANVGMLALTHVSARYAPRQLAEEAEEVFPGTIVARDFDVVELPFPERGAPVHVPKGARARRGATPEVSA